MIFNKTPENEKETADKLPVLPVLPLRNIVVFPRMYVPLFVGREKSVNALEEVMGKDKRIFLVTQKDKDIEDPKTKDLYKVGTISTVLQLLKLPDDTVKVLVEGGPRAVVRNYVDEDGFMQAEIEELLDDPIDEQSELEALSRAVVSQFEEYIKLNKKIPPEVLVSINQIDEVDKLTDTMAFHLSTHDQDKLILFKQELLESTNLTDRLERIYSFMEGEIEVLQVERKVRGRVKKQMERTQRDYYLNEQLKAIQKELGGSDEDGGDDVNELTTKIAETKLSKEAKEKAEAEMKKLKNMSPMSAEATVVRNYLDTLLGLPWGKSSRLKKDLKKAQKVLDNDHYGLEKVKERIVEYLAVQQRVKKIKGPILCLVGPPGVGKTSLGKSVASATGREFVRISLGGVRDEAEIRGHRRTYIGSMPGKILQAMKKAGTINPMFLLDEIDKMSADFRGDPGSALLEVLDPEQNATFNDHYMEIDYDLSNVMFMTTANTLRMPQPLMDRMEIIRLSGYTEDEKVEISRRHLIPKLLKRHGVKKGEWSISDSALRDLIRFYTREAGVRNLEREVANLVRKAIKQILLKPSKKSVAVSQRNLASYAGIQKYRYGEIEEEDMVGMTTGLAWTEVGGEILHIEAVMLPGKGKLMPTGNLKDVMKESIQAAESYVKAHSTEFGIKPTIFEKSDIHVHVPEGATPKDGPSAGVGMLTSIVSVLTGIPVRKDIAMTGEITLRGRVLPIGGLKEKLLAALRGGIKTVLIPKDNEKDLAEIPDNVKKGMEIIPVTHADEVLKHALTKGLEPIEWTPKDIVAAEASKATSGSESGVVKH